MQSLVLEAGIEMRPAHVYRPQWVDEEGEPSREKRLMIHIYRNHYVISLYNEAVSIVTGARLQGNGFFSIADLAV